MRQIPSLALCAALLVFAGMLVVFTQRPETSGARSARSENAESEARIRTFAVAGDEVGMSGETEWGGKVARLELEVEFVRKLAADARRDGGGVEIPVSGGRVLRGLVDLLPVEGAEDVEGRITHPKPGRFFFHRQTMPGVAGEVVGVVLFDDGSPGYRVEPLGVNGGPVLVQRDVHDLICANEGGYGLERGEEEPEAEAMKLSEDHPVMGEPTPEYQNGVPIYASRPGSPAVLYLDFDGEEGPFGGWGDFDAPPSAATPAEIYSTWLEVAEDFLPFNFNVTTNLADFHAAPNNSRMRIIITPTTEAWDGRTGVVGVAYVGSFNWTSDSPCWAWDIPGGQLGQVISHELGHTLKLRHDGSPTDSYYRGHGAGETSWGPIMGSALYANMRQWSQGEYLGRTNSQDDVWILANSNNRTDYHPDLVGNNIGSANLLDVVPIAGVVNDKEIIENRWDKDVFSFKTNGGTVSLTIEGQTQFSNIDIEATLFDSSGTPLVVDNPTNTTDASIVTVLTAGEYFLQVDGVGYGDPYFAVEGQVLEGYVDYGSIGGYKITGTIANPDAPQRIEVAENLAPATVVGTVEAKNAHGANPLTYLITGGNPGGLFEVDGVTGAIRVAAGAAIDFEGLAGNWTTTPVIFLEVGITDTVDSGLNETVTVRLPITDVNEAPSFESLPTVTIYETTELGATFATVRGVDEDFFQGLTYSITAGDPSGYFEIHPETGALSLMAAPAVSGVTFNLTIQVQDSAIPPLSATGVATVTIGGLPPGFSAENKAINPLSYLADSIEEWSAAPDPGEAWTYGSDDGSGFVELDSLSTIGAVEIGGSGQAHTLAGGLPAVGQFSMAPADTVAAVRRWTSTYRGSVKVAYDAMRLETSGDGQRVVILHNGTEVFSQVLSNAVPHAAGELIVAVSGGDRLDFRMESGGGGDAVGDWTHFHARIIDRYRGTEDSGLLFRYAMDESYLHPPVRAGVAVDSSGNNRHATVEASAPVLAWVEGEIDNAAHLDGTNDALSSDANDIGDGASALTLSAWIRPDVKEPLDAIFGSSGVTRFALDLSDTGVGNPVRFQVGPVSVVGPDNSGVVGRWTHVVGVWSSGDVLKLYLNGVEVASGTGPVLVPDVDQWLVGRDAPVLPPTHYFDGRIDDVALWSRALDAAEVRALFENGEDVQEFDGTSADVYTLPHSPIADGATEMTLAGWINPADKDDNDAFLSTRGPSFCGLLLSGYGSGNPVEFRALGNRITAENNSGPVGQWTHAVGVWKQGEFQRFYLNGVEVTGSPSPSPPSGTFDIDDWVVGRDRDTSSRTYEGELGNLLIMERALSEAEVVALHGVGQYNVGASRAAFDRSDEVGMPTAAGTFEEISGRYLLNASGAGFSGTADTGHLVSRPHSGDGAIGALIDSVENVAAGAESGVMIRESVAADAAFAFLYRRPDHAVGLRWRSTTGAATQEIAAVPATGEPGWVRLARRGNRVIALYSADGAAWTKLGAIDLPMAGVNRFGLAATSGLDGSIGSSYFHAAAMGDLGTDADLDGLPDSWEDTHYGGLEGTEGETDLDGDGFTERDEYISGTDPNDRDSYFVAKTVAGATAAEAVLSWPAVAGRVYAIETSMTLEGGSWTLFADQIPANPPLNSEVVPVDGPERFYRVGVEYPEP